MRGSAHTSHPSVHYGLTVWIAIARRRKARYALRADRVADRDRWRGGLWRIVQGSKQWGCGHDYADQHEHDDQDGH